MPAGEVQVVDDVAAAFVEVVTATSPRTVALSGGGTARRCYEALRAAGSAVDWPAVTALLGDERWVPVDHPDSNEGMARRALLDHVPVGEVRSAVEAAPGAGPITGAGPEAAADAYDATVTALASLDLVHLGLGEDGHTASLFPGSPALDVRDRHVVATGDDAHPWPRLTLTFPAIAASSLAVVTVSGAAKREAWAAVVQGADVPAARLAARRLVWLVDREAAAGA